MTECIIERNTVIPFIVKGHLRIWWIFFTLIEHETLIIIIIILGLLVIIVVGPTYNKLNISIPFIIHISETK